MKNIYSQHEKNTSSGRPLINTSRYELSCLNPSSFLFFLCDLVVLWSSFGRTLTYWGALFIVFSKNGEKSPSKVRKFKSSKGDSMTIKELMELTEIMIMFFQELCFLSLVKTSWKLIQFLHIFEKKSRGYNIVE